MPVTSTRNDYDKMLLRWTKCRDVYEGTAAVKNKGQAYLPAVGDHESNPKKYEIYKLRALFFNAMRRTVEGLTGAIFQKSLITIVPEGIVEHLKDITLTSVSLEMFALNVTHEVFITGRYGVLVDMSNEQANEQRPYWIGYRPENIISWHTERRGGDEILTQVVLREFIEIQDPKDTFLKGSLEQYRVLELTPEGPPGSLHRYMQTIWRKDEKQNEWMVFDSTVPVRRGVQLDFIPFKFLGAMSVSPEIERPPLEDVVDVNISHYQSMADLEWGRHFTALPTPWVAGHTGIKGDTLQIGSGVAWTLEKDGRAGMLEFTGAGLGALEKADVQKRRMMATLGARLLEEQPGQPETLGAVGLRHAGEHASLRTVAQVIEQGLTTALQWHVWWVGTAISPREVEANLELNKDFLTVKASPEEVKTLLFALQSDKISYATFYEGLQKGEWAREGVSAEEELKTIQREGPMNGEPIGGGIGAE